jgi:excisionase family DNA binding protein
MTTTQAAEFLGVNDSRVRQLTRSGTLPAVKVGRDWLIEEDVLKQYKDTLRERNQKKPGRPFKT